MTLEAVADELHTTHATLSRVERGVMPYNQPLLEGLADLYSTDPASLLTRDPAGGDPLWEAIDALTPEQRQQVAEIASVLKRSA